MDKKRIKEYLSKIIKKAKKENKLPDNPRLEDIVDLEKYKETIKNEDLRSI